MVNSMENMQSPRDILIEGFTARLHREGLAPGSIDQYVRSVNALIGAFPERRPQDLSRDDVETWIDMVARDVSPATTNLRIAALKRFYAYLVDREIVTGANPTARLKASKLHRRKVDWLQADEDQALLKAPTTPQERIVVGLLRHTGLRIGEARGLRVRDVDFERGEVRIHAAKSESGIRIVPIRGEAVVELKAWLGYLDKHGRAAPDAYFLSTRNGTPMQANQARDLVKRCARRAGVRVTGDGTHDSSVSCHTLRRTFGSYLLNKGARLETVARLLGHADTRTTERCYAALLPDTVRDDMWKALSA